MNWRKFITLIKREFKLLSTNRVILLIVVGAPLAYGILFGCTYHKAKGVDLPVIVIDKDQTHTSQKLVDMIDDNETLKIVRILAEEINVKQLLIDNKCDAVIVIPDRFEADILQKRTPEVNVNTNMSNILTANFSVKALQVTLGSFNAGIEMEGLRKQGIPESQATKQYDAVKVNYNRFFNASANYMYFLWPGLLGTVYQQVLLLALALSFAREFEEKTYKTQFMTHTRSPFWGILVKCLPFWIISLFILLTFRLMYAYFQVPFHPNILALTLLLILFTLSLSFLGTLFSLIFPKQLQATEALMIIGMPSFVISGFTWPLSLMPLWVNAVAEIIPLTHFLQAFRTLTNLGGSLHDIALPLIKLGILTIIYYMACFLWLKYKTRKLEKAEL